MTLPRIRILHDIAQGFDSPLEADSRLTRALELLRGLVPYDHCGLLEAPLAGAARWIVEPDAPAPRGALDRLLTRFLTVLTDERLREGGWLPPDLASQVPCASHLAVPLVALDRVQGVLFVSHREADAYTEDHLQLVSLVASQITAYLGACRLREQEAHILRDHEAARASAEAQNRAKDEFLAMLAHELRNPARAIRTAMQTIRGQGARDPIVGRAREVVERQVGHLTRLLDDLLDVSRLTRGKIELHKETITLQMVIAEALETTRGFFGDRRPVEAVSLPDTPLWFEGDPTRVTQVVGNLLDNAAKYTPWGGQISVTGYSDGGEVVLRVRDTGIGVAAERQSRVFDLFTQSEPPLPPDAGGLGVGLALARALTELHGGMITVESEGPGRGSEFVVRLPIGAPVRDRDDRRRGPVPPRRILLVDDDDNVRRALRRILELDGHRVEVARDGLEGVALMLATAPEVAFVDIRLPGIDGHEVARRIRMALGRRVLLVALTAHSRTQDRRRSSEAGFDAHLVKPVSYEDLERVLAGAAGGDG
jgi:signal transduction histidine kinase